jgi:hypothetical protein
LTRSAAAPAQVSVAVLLDNFVSASTRMENEERGVRLREKKASARGG